VPGCREQVEPADPEIVEAVELVEVVTFGPGRQWREGLHVFFHRSHYPTGSRRYRLID
jgi:hypothetical protein